MSTKKIFSLMAKVKKEEANLKYIITYMTIVPEMT